MAPVNVDSYAINTGKKTSQNEKGGFEVLRFIFSVIDVPRCAILVFRGSPSQVVLKKIWPPKNVSPFFWCLYETCGSEVLLAIFSEWKVPKNPTSHTWSMQIVLPM
jgi:hypothetical protein